MANTYFDIQALKNWFDMQTATYAGKPVCLKVEFYQKIGNRVVGRETKSFDGTDLKDTTGNLPELISKYTYDHAWSWLMQTIDSFIPSGVIDLTIFYMTSNGSAKSHYPIKLTQKTGEKLELSNLMNFTNQNNKPDLIGTLREALKSNTGKTEEEIRAEVRHELEQQKRIEDLESMVENIREEKLGSLKKIGYILEASPELGKAVAGLVQGIAGLVGSQIGKMVNNMSNQQQAAQVGIIHAESNEQIYTVEMALNEVKKQFPNEEPVLTLLKLLKVLEENESFRPMLIGMMQKIKL